MNFLEQIFQYIQSDPVQAASLALLIVAPIVTFGVLLWGLAQVWLFFRQGRYWENLKWDLLEVSVPQDAINTPKGIENFFTNIAGSKSSITWKEKWIDGKFQAYFSFEIVSIGGRITFYIRTQKKYRDVVEAALYAQYPEAYIAEAEDYVDQFPKDYPNEETDLFGSEMVLRGPNYQPIRTYEMFEHVGEKDLRFKDPLLPLIEGMGKMRPGENYMIQILVMQPDEQDWRKEGQKFIEESYGKEPPEKKGRVKEAVGWIPEEILNQVAGIEKEEQSQQDNWAMFKITPQEKERLDAVTRKISKLGWLTKIRWVYVAKKELFRKGTMASMSKGIFHQFAYLGWNKLGLHGPSTPKDDYFFQEWQMPMKQRRLMNRYAERSFSGGSTPYILNSEELATIWHFPAAEARTPVLTAMGARRAEAPVDLESIGPGEDILPNLERNMPGGASEAVTIPEKPEPLATPRPASPTAKAADTAFDEPSVEAAPPTVHGMPQAGMPAPLPPGLDVSDQPAPSDEEKPNNLPT